MRRWRHVQMGVRIDRWAYSAILISSGQRKNLVVLNAHPIGANLCCIVRRYETH